MKYFLWGAILCALFFQSCAMDIYHKAEVSDLEPPGMITYGWTGLNTLEVLYDETLDCGQLCGDPSPKGDLYFMDTRARIILKEVPKPGAPVRLRLEVKDAAQNLRQSELVLVGVNPHPATLVFNELGAAGTSKKPDFVEFAVVNPGDLAGLVFLIGTPGDAEIQFILPSREVTAGELVVLRCPGGAGFYTGEWDIILPDGCKFVATSGVMTLRESSDGPVQDCLVYSNRTSQSDVKYGGWGSKKMQSRAEWVRSQGHWEFGGDTALPEKAAGSLGMSLTRTLCRLPDQGGKASAKLWRICEKGRASPGAVNQL